MLQNKKNLFHITMCLQILYDLQ